MEMDMDMDIGWCLACSKRTRDQRSPYCSEACRKNDLSPEKRVNEAQAITSPLPPKFIPLPPTSANLSRNPSDKRPSGRGADARRPDPTPLPGRGPILSDETSATATALHPQRRDRRAFSFPASDENERPALPFVRKAEAVNGTPKSFKRHLNLANDLARMSLSTGANTPNFESTFDSTSDSSAANDNNELTVPTVRRRSLAPFSSLHPTVPACSPRLPSPARVQSPSAASPVATAHASSDSRNPITRMGSSSRSREDIMSWARGVGADSSPSLHGDSDEEQGTQRGRRPRARRPLTLANLPPPSTEPLDEPFHGSTPKGSVGALGALHMTFTPVVNAFRRVSVAAAPAIEQTTSSLGLATGPAAPAEVSIVDVIVATRNTEANANSEQQRPVFESDTPPLSTVSLSEALDPSTSTDFGETIETATDDFSVISSSIDRRPSFSPRVHGAQISNAPNSKDFANPVAPLHRRSSLRPIQSTASAIWNLSSYLRSLTPFAVPTSFVPPFTSTAGEPVTPTAVAEPAESSTASATAQKGLASPMPTTSLHANLGEALEESLHEQEDMVRSVPLDIVVTGSAAALCEERQREREAIELIKQGAGSRPLTPARSPSPTPSARRRQEEEDLEDQRRGRGRGRTRGRAPTPPPAAEGEETRGRRRDRWNESRDRSWSPCRYGRRPSRNRDALLAAFVGVD